MGNETSGYGGEDGPMTRWHRWCDPAPWWNMKARLYPWRRYRHLNGWEYHTEEQHARWCLEQEFGPRPDAAGGEASLPPYPTTQYNADTDMEIKKR